MVADLPGYRGYAYSVSDDRTRHHPFLNFIFGNPGPSIKSIFRISLTRHDTVSPRHSGAYEEIHCETHTPVESHSAGRRHVIARHRGGGRSDGGDGGDGGPAAPARARRHRRGPNRA